MENVTIFDIITSPKTFVSIRNRAMCGLLLCTYQWQSLSLIDVTNIINKIMGLFNQSSLSGQPASRLPYVTQTVFDQGCERRNFEAQKLRCWTLFEHIQPCSFIHATFVGTVAFGTWYLQVALSLTEGHMVMDKQSLFCSLSLSLSVCLSPPSLSLPPLSLSLSIYLYVCLNLSLSPSLFLFFFSVSLSPSHFPSSIMMIITEPGICRGNEDSRGNENRKSWKIFFHGKTKV